MASTLVAYVQATLGDDAPDQLVRAAGVEYTAAHLRDVANWIWYDEAIALFEAAVELTGDETVCRRVGELAVRQHAGTPVATLMRSLGSPQAVYEQLTVGSTKFSTVSQLVPLEVGPGRAVVRAQGRDGFKRHRHLCEWTAGLLSTPPELFGLPSARVEQSACEAAGDDHCLYTVTWDAEGAARAADPQQLVTALETQLAAMTQRLESMYATARDLIAIEDLDTALGRITERAATAVRAPRYLLAVRTGPEAHLHVHHRGFVDDDLERTALSLLDGDGGPRDGGRLIAEIRSGTRRYGRLMAESPAGAFFAHEQDLLDFYAGFAAAVLDTATAFDEARRRNEQSQALLSLSRAMASATTRDDVAQRLADAVPAVVDCDRVVTFLWDEREEALVCHAITGFDGSRDQLIRDMRIRPSDTPTLARLRDTADPKPLFFERNTSDGFIASTLRQTGSRRLVVVPIVAHGHLYGILNVSAAERPERLSETQALRTLLSGVVAQAATALDNARLIETMAHQARFDNLTGLLGHRAFHEALGIELGGSERPFTLASIDLDDFKLVNDLYGHPVGDEALRRVAEALRGAVREQDAVFRVGGEEFAVLMTGVSASDALPIAERLRTTVARTAFTLPLRVSVGLASWPVDASDRDELLERADAALYAAKRGGKNRIVAATDGATRATGEAPDARTSLLDVLRSKDGDTLAHSAHVAALAVDVGERLGISGQRLSALRIAGQLHDVGKLAVPDEILNKPAALDEDEMRLVRTHPQVGAELVRAWGFPDAARCVLEHHERLDGSGYPAGLVGEAITLEGRILHVVDAFAAMTADRPYRARMEVDAALAELRAFTGTQFDPEVVAALEALVRASHADEPGWTVDTVAGERSSEPDVNG